MPSSASRSETEVIAGLQVDDVLSSQPTRLALYAGAGAHLAAVALACTWSPARAAPARPRWPARWRWPWPASGQRVLLVEVEGRQGLAQLFDTPPLPYAETRLAATRGGEVIGLAVDAEAAMLEYLEMFYNIKRAGSVLRKMGAIDFVTTIAPGLRDVLLTGKVKEAVTRTGQDGRPVFDAVVLDAPPTGRITQFLQATHEVAGLTKIGPIHRQSAGRDRPAALRADRGAHGHPAGGDAGAGDPGRRRRAARGRLPARPGDREPGPSGAGRRPAGRARRMLADGLRRGRPGPRAGPGAGSRGDRLRRAPGRPGARPRPSWPRSARRSAGCPSWRRRWTWAACSSWPTPSTSREWAGMSRATRPAAGARRRRAAEGPGR